jgi:hypothetical protein
MALKDLTTQQMARTSGKWLGALKPSILEVPELGGSVLILERVHNGLHLPARDAAPLSDPLRQLIVEQKALDLRHDALIRGLIHILLGYSYLEEGPEATRLSHLVEDLFPLGLELITQTYEEEAGAAGLLEKKLSPEVRGALQGIPLLGGNALERVLELVQKGKQIGDLEDQKRSLRKAQDAAPSDPKLSVARTHWIRGVNAFLNNLGVADVSEETRQAILEPLREALAVAERRKKGEEAEDDSPTPEGAVGETSGA